MLATENELFGQFNGTAIRSKTLQVIRGGAGYALKDLDGVARDAAAATVVQRASETCLILVVGIYVDVLVLLQAVEVVVLLAGADDALFNQELGVTAGRLVRLCLRLLVRATLGSVFARLDLICDLTKFLANVTARFIAVAIMAHETLHLDGVCCFDFIFGAIRGKIVQVLLRDARGRLLGSFNLEWERLDGAGDDKAVLAGTLSMI